MEFLAGLAVGILGVSLLTCVVLLAQKLREKLGKPLFLLLSYVGIFGTALFCIWVNRWLVDETSLGKGHVLTGTWVVIYASACFAFAVRNARKSR